jgi:hypothetical protein
MTDANLTAALPAPVAEYVIVDAPMEGESSPTPAWGRS